MASQRTVWRRRTGSPQPHSSGSRRPGPRPDNESGTDRPTGLPRRPLPEWLAAQDQVHGRRMEYPIGVPIRWGSRSTTRSIGCRSRRGRPPRTSAGGGPRNTAGVVELTGLVDLTCWPIGMRLVVRCEKRHPGAGLTSFEQADGCLSGPGTSTRIGSSVPRNPARRACSRQERIRTARDPVPGRLRSRDSPDSTGPESTATRHRRTARSASEAHPDCGSTGDIHKRPRSRGDSVFAS